MRDVFLVLPAANISSCARWNQNGTTIAGNQNGLSGSNLSMLRYPTSIHINRFDNTLYVGDSANKRVIKFKQSESKGQVVAKGFLYCNGIDVDGEQNLYVGEYSEIWKIPLDSGIIQIIAGGNAGNRSDELRQVDGLMLDEEKNLYISDTGNHRIVMFKPNAKIGFLLAGVTGKNAKDSLHFDEPRGIYIDSFFNTLYVADSKNNRIQRFHPIGNETGETVAGTPYETGDGLHQPIYPTSVTVLNNRDIYVADTENHRIVRWMIGNYSANGTCIVGCTGESGISANMLNKPKDFKFDSNGNLIVSDTYNHRIQKFDLLNNEC
jgi:DNA-binding beta-propeller fold protein YncE